MSEKFYPRHEPDLSTEQIVKIAESLPDNEQIQCSTVLLPAVELIVFLDNKPSEQVQVSVQAIAPGYAQTALFTLNSTYCRFKEPVVLRGLTSEEFQALSIKVGYGFALIHACQITP